jgi:hypothetical protein
MFIHQADNLKGKSKFKIWLTMLLIATIVISTYLPSTADQSASTPIKLQIMPYQVLEVDETSAMIYSPKALTKDQRAHTAMQAAIDLQKKTGSDYVSVTMTISPKLKDCGLSEVASAGYGPYHEGWNIMANDGSMDDQAIQANLLACEYEAKHPFAPVDWDKTLHYVRKKLHKSEKELPDIPGLLLLYPYDNYEVSTDLACAFGSTSTQEAQIAVKSKNPNLHFTKEKCIACLTQDSLNRLAQIIIQKDWEAAQKMLSNFECISYPVGSQVYIMESSGPYIVKIRAKGSTDGLWTLRDFLN